MITLKNTPIFVVHYKKLTDRKRYLDEWFSKNQIVPNWILDGQREDLDENTINQFYRFDPSVYERELSLGEIGCTIGHIVAYKEILQRNYPYAIIFEDDVFLPEDFQATYDSIMAKCPSDFDMISLGSCLGIHHNNIREGERFYRVIPARGRCGYAQVISNRACRLAIKYSSPFHYPADWQFYNIASNNPEHQFVTYWIEPPIAFEGSSTGKYQSCLR